MTGDVQRVTHKFALKQNNLLIPFGFLYTYIYTYFQMCVNHFESHLGLLAANGVVCIFDGFVW